MAAGEGFECKTRPDATSLALFCRVILLEKYQFSCCCVLPKFIWCFLGKVKNKVKIYTLLFYSVA